MYIVVCASYSYYFKMNIVFFFLHFLKIAVHSELINNSLIFNYFITLSNQHEYS